MSTPAARFDCDRAAAVPGTVQRRRIRVRGLVQGVGFRPHVYRSAQRFGMAGFVRNDSDGVLIEAEGLDLDGFLAALKDHAPPLARIDDLASQPLPVRGERGFAIEASAEGRLGAAAIPADTALCEDCLAELFDPANRRYRHPFIACTSCGPRFTMTRQLPYDRTSTAMADFDLCPACRAEYEDPADRRFHAEPVACHECGPKLGMEPSAIAAALVRGEIVAIKGIGGYHLACDARDAQAVARLRARKQRDGKPFAVMVLNAASAARHARVDAAARAVLESRRRPVTILDRTDGVAALAAEVSPGLRSVGLLLPYTAIHYLVFHTLLGEPAGTAWLAAPNAFALVMTSANVSGDPLLIDDLEASEKLAGIADRIAGHDREIAVRADDSVVRATTRGTILVRRARGYAPVDVRLARSGPRVLALGAHLKATVTLTRDDRACLSPHVGDLDSPEAVAFHAATARQLQAMARCEPERLACDWHRDYASTRLAEALSRETGVPLIRVQHHHAHVAAVLAEHRHRGPALGLALDGHGLGEGGASWGGELLVVDGGAFRRLGHFAPLAAPGGDRAAREPWRMAAAALHRLGRGGEIPARFPDQPLAAAVAQLLADGEVPATTSAGRLIDAAAGLLSVCSRAAFEGEPPMRLEGLARSPTPLAGGFSIDHGVLAFDGLLEALSACDDPARGADWLHGTLIDGLVAWVTAAAGETGITTVALSGGCFLNAHLATGVPHRLRKEGLRVLTAQQAPPNDGGISLGQAWVAQRAAPGAASAEGG